MNSDEFWCRAFLEAMRDHAGDLERCQEIADAALWRAQRRGMVTGEQTASAGPEIERVEFTADIDRSNPNLWRIGVHQIGVFRAWPGEPTATLDGNVIRIKWSESAPPKPIEVRIDRAKGSAR